MTRGMWIALAAIVALIGIAYMARGKISSGVLLALEHLEGRKNRAYLDTAGYWTIGIGHKVLPTEMAKYVGTSVVIDGKKRGGIVITEAEIDRLAAQDTARAAASVDRSVKVPIHDLMRSALIAFAFNVGVSAFEGSTLLKLLNVGDYVGARGQFKAWNKETKNGVKVVNNGLTARRLAEETMFSNGMELIA